MTEHLTNTIFFSFAFVLFLFSRGFKSAFVMHAFLSVITFRFLRGFRTMGGKSAATTATTTITTGASTTTQSSAIQQTPKCKSESPDVLKGLSQIFTSFSKMFFLFLVLMTGISSGLIENFAYVRMRELGGGGREMGVSRLVSSLGGVPAFWYASAVSKYLGVNIIMLFALLSYAIRFFIYANAKSCWMALPAEAMRGATFGLFWTTATIEANRIAPPGMLATVLAILNAMYGGLGQSLGAIIGGKLQERFGTVKMFMIGGSADLIFVLLASLYFLWKNFLSSSRQEEKEG